MHTLGSVDAGFLGAISAGFSISRGMAMPLGASLTRTGINFALVSGRASAVHLVLYSPQEFEPLAEFPLDPHMNRTGDVWHLMVEGLGSGIEYGFRVFGAAGLDPSVHRFEPQRVLLDPYAKAISGRKTWGLRPGFCHTTTLESGVRRSVVVRDDYDWEHDQPLNTPLADSIIYELHVRGFTRHDSSGAAEPGTYQGLVEKIPYLRELGITAVELLPVFEFEECDNEHTNPETGEQLKNYWGYHPISFFAPKASYAADVRACGAVTEFRDMVKALHKAGIEIILDVVFNHTGEGNHLGPTLSFRGIDNSLFYIIDPGNGDYANYSGCGNTLNCNHPVVREMILDSLRYWVTEMHVDGFRFDLAAILGRGQDGSVRAHPPLLERIAADPILANTKLIAEAWDAAGLYQVGSFPAWGRWAEWNGVYRDDIRRFVRGEADMVKALAARLAGSADIYQCSDRHPWHSINFVTCHDGFTLADLVAYNHKHNDANGEGSHDGCNNNISWNCGIEGATGNSDVLSMRRRQIRNFLALLMVSCGVPMLQAGDEFGRSQQGNNNAYCQDNDIGWIDWRDVERNSGLLRFTRELSRLRARYPALRRNSYTGEGDDLEFTTTWHGVLLDQPDWSTDSRSLGMHVTQCHPSGHLEHIYLIANTWWESLEFELPPIGAADWHRVVDTGNEAPQDISSEGDEILLEDQRHYRSVSRSVVVLVGK